MGNDLSTNVKRPKSGAGPDELCSSSISSREEDRGAPIQRYGSLLIECNTEQLASASTPAASSLFAGSPSSVPTASTREKGKEKEKGGAKKLAGSSSSKSKNKSKGKGKGNPDLNDAMDKFLQNRGMTASESREPLPSSRQKVNLLGELVDYDALFEDNNQFMTDGVLKDAPAKQNSREALNGLLTEVTSSDHENGSDIYSNAFLLRSSASVESLSSSTGSSFDIGMPTNYRRSSMRARPDIPPKNGSADTANVNNFSYLIDFHMRCSSGSSSGSSIVDQASVRALQKRVARMSSRSLSSEQSINSETFDAKNNNSNNNNSNNNSNTSHHVAGSRTGTLPQKNPHQPHIPLTDAAASGSFTRRRVSIVDGDENETREANTAAVHHHATRRGMYKNGQHQHQHRNREGSGGPYRRYSSVPHDTASSSNSNTHVSQRHCNSADAVQLPAVHTAAESESLRTANNVFPTGGGINLPPLVSNSVHAGSSHSLGRNADSTHTAPPAFPSGGTCDTQQRPLSEGGMVLAAPTRTSGNALKRPALEAFTPLSVSSEALNKLRMQGRSVQGDANGGVEANSTTTTTSTTPATMK